MNENVINVSKKSSRGLKPSTRLVLLYFELSSVANSAEAAKLICCAVKK